MGPGASTSSKAEAHALLCVAQLVTLMALVTGLAALKFALPAWVAVILQVPAAR